MVDFAKLKELSGKKGLEALNEKVAKLAGNNAAKNEEDNFWKPTVDKAGNGYAVIRFLPAPNGEDVPFVRYWDHAFQGPTGLWYFEKCLSSLGNPDPVMELNSKLWNSNTSDESKERKQARKQKRRLHYICNIYVIQDQGNPENEGKVKLFKFGKKIFDKLNEAMNPQFADEEPMNPFDLWAGANFKLKIRNVEGYRNYDKSEFDKPKALFADDSKMEEVYSQELLLQPFVDPKSFKSYDELKAKLAKVLSDSTEMPRAEAMESTPAPMLKEARPKIEEESPFVDDGDDDSLELFRNLANT